MNSLARKLLVIAVLAFAATALLLPAVPATDRAEQSSATEPVPAFHSAPPTGSLPPTMEASLFTDKLVFNAYVVAGRVKKVLYQEPCYCHCDRSQGHSSLLECFVSRHGSSCDICMKEAFYSYKQTRKGKTPAEIREGILRGDWQKVDLAKYQTDYLAPLAN